MNYRGPNASRIERLLRERILIIDGAMGTMIQRQSLGEADFRGKRFADHRETCGATTTCSRSHSRS